MQNYSSQNMLFNNNTGDAGVTIANDATTNKPSIYFPTTACGVKSISITTPTTSSFWLTFKIKDDTGTSSVSKQITSAGTTTFDFNTTGQTTVCIQYAMTVWPRISQIDFTTELGLADDVAADNETAIAAMNGKTCNVALNRSFVADGGYYTLCLPFDLSEEQVADAFGICTLAKLTSSELLGEELIHLNFDYVNSIEAGVPYLFLPTADVVNPVFQNVTIDADATKTISTTYFRMIGIYDPTPLTASDYFLGADNYLVPVSGSNPLRPFRAYFQLVAPIQPKTMARVVLHSNQTTDITNANANANTVKVLRNGHLVIIRDGKTYNAMGQIIK